jgi:hypothetical protein
MEDLLSALTAPARAIRHLIEDCDASPCDLIDVGLSDYMARKRLRTIAPRALAPNQAVQITPIGLPDVVALVSTNELGRRYLNHGVYIRDAQLHGQIRLRATYIGYSSEGAVEAVRPITNRWRIGSAAAIPATGLTNLAAVMAEPDVNSSWRGSATLIELGAPIPIGLPLGFAASANGAAPALRNMRHVLLANLLAAVASGAALVDVAPL